VFLTGTILNVVTVLVGTVIGVLIGSRMPPRIQTALTDGLGLFVVLLGVSMGMRVLTDPAALPGDELAVLAAVLLGAAIGELLRLQDGLEGLGSWFQGRLSRQGEPSRIAEAFITASIVFCVGPLTILGSIENGLTGEIRLLAVKSLLDGVAAIAFAAALGWGVALSAITVLVVQGAIAGGAFLLRDVMDERTILVVTAAGGVILLGVAFVSSTFGRSALRASCPRSCSPRSSFAWATRSAARWAEPGSGEAEDGPDVSGARAAWIDDRRRGVLDERTGQRIGHEAKLAQGGDRRDVARSSGQVAILDLRRNAHRSVAEWCRARKRSRRQPDGLYTLGTALGDDAIGETRA
jgi:uncharacterized membrane protein YqgA involved in biofilm formation